MRIFLTLKTRICLFRPLFGDGPGAETAQSLLSTSFVCPHVCVMCVYEYASTKRHGYIEHPSFIVQVRGKGVTAPEQTAIKIVNVEKRGFQASASGTVPCTEEECPEMFSSKMDLSITQTSENSIRP